MLDLMSSVPQDLNYVHLFFCICPAVNTFILFLILLQIQKLFIVTSRPSPFGLSQSSINLTIFTSKPRQTLIVQLYRSAAFFLIVPVYDIYSDFIIHHHEILEHYSVVRSAISAGW
jgi:hypothetical protein